MNSVIENYPDITFIDDATVDEVLSQMVNDYQEKYRELTGKEVSLAQADPYRLIMYACTMQIYQAMQYADYAGKMSFLKYARGDYLDNLAALRGIERLQAASAVTKLVFRIDNAMQFPVGIPEGTRVTNGSGAVCFATEKYAEIENGETEVLVPAVCAKSGSEGNGFEAGEINVLVNTIPYVSSVMNTEKTTGGADMESDDNLRNRVYFSSGSYSVAGPADAYVYWTKSLSPIISDVTVLSDSPGEVKVYFICEGGEVPEDSLIEKVEAALRDDNIRPLTDRVSVYAPQTRGYEIEFTYYISESDKAAALTIQNDVRTAVEIYKQWQSEKLGRDINPSYLVQKVMEAGAKRVEVSSPAFTEVEPNMIASCESVSAIYGGLEDD